MKTAIKATLRVLGYELTPIPRASLIASLPDAEFYTPRFSPWLGYGPFKALWDLAGPHTIVSAERCYVLYVLASQALSLRGDFWECGVYKGGTSLLLAELLARSGDESSRLHVFDTFEGMPDTDPSRDFHRRGEFGDTSLAAIRALVGRGRPVVFHPGLIPDTFHAMDDARIAFAHIDVDIYKSVADCCAFIMPRLTRGGFVVFDDYGFPSCPGARQAVDEFFADRPEKPLVLPTGQAVVFALG
jgi:O-methyltransferase